MITSYTPIRRGDVTTVTVTSDLAGVVYYHWYLDGSFVETTRKPSRTFKIAPGTQASVDVRDSIDPDATPAAKLDDAYSSRRTIWWIRSLSTDVEKYRVEQSEDGGDWSEVAVVARDGETWTYEATTPPLTDLASIAFRVVPIDATNNEGTALTLPAVDIVRRPDAPVFTATFDEGTSRVTFAEAS